MGVPDEPKMHVEPMIFAKIEREAKLPVTFWKQGRCVFQLITWEQQREAAEVWQKNACPELWARVPL